MASPVSDEEIEYAPKKLVVEPRPLQDRRSLSFRKGNESDRITRLEIKRLTDDCEAKYPDLPVYSYGTSLDGLREITWPGVSVSFAPASPGCLALCSRGRGKKIRMQYKMWMVSDYEMLLVYINQRVFYHRSNPIPIPNKNRMSDGIEIGPKVFAKSFTEGFTLRKADISSDSSDSDSSDIEEKINEYGKTLASVVFSKWTSI